MPQIENGYTKIAHELLEAIVLADMSKREYKVVFAIIRLSYGWSKKTTEKRAGITTLCSMTGYKDNVIYSTIKSLKDKNIIGSKKIGNQNEYFIKKKYQKWTSHKTLPVSNHNSNETLPVNSNETLPVNSNETLPSNMYEKCMDAGLSKGLKKDKENIKKNIEPEIENPKIPATSGEIKTGQKYNIMDCMKECAIITPTEKGKSNTSKLIELGCKPEDFKKAFHLNSKYFKKLESEFEMMEINKQRIIREEADRPKFVC